MSNIILVSTLLLIFCLFCISFFKKSLIVKENKRNVLIHDLKGAIVTYELTLQGLREKLNTNNKDDNFSSIIEMLEEIKEDIQKSLNKFCGKN